MVTEWSRWRLLEHGRRPRDARITASRGRGAPMFDLLYLLLTVVLFGLSIAMIRFFDRL